MIYWLRMVLLYLSWAITNGFLFGIVLFISVTKALQNINPGTWVLSIYGLIPELILVFGFVVLLQSLSLQLVLRNRLLPLAFWIGYGLANTMGWAFLSVALFLSDNGPLGPIITMVAVVSVLMAQGIFVVSGANRRKWFLSWLCVSLCAIGVIQGVYLFFLPVWSIGSEWREVVPGGLYGLITGVFTLWFFHKTVRLPLPVSRAARRAAAR